MADPKEAPQETVVVKQLPNDPPAPLNADAQGSHRVVKTHQSVTQITINGASKTVSALPTGIEIYGLAGEVLGHPATQVHAGGLPSPNPENARLRAAMGRHHPVDGVLLVNGPQVVALIQDQEFTAI